MTTVDTLPIATTTTYARPPAADAAIVDASTTSGDRASVSLSVGRPTPAASADLPTGVDCYGADDARSMIVRVDAAMTLSSTLPADLKLELFMTPLGPPTMMIGDYSDGPVCFGSDTSVSTRHVAWNDIAPNSSRTFTFWIVALNAITPAAPDGDPMVLGQLLLAPRLLFGAPTTNTFSGGHTVTCDTTHTYVALGPIDQVRCPGMGP